MKIVELSREDELERELSELDFQHRKAQKQLLDANRKRDKAEREVSRLKQELTQLRTAIGNSKASGQEAEGGLIVTLRNERDRWRGKYEALRDSHEDG